MNVDHQDIRTIQLTNAGCFVVDHNLHSGLRRRRQCSVVVAAAAAAVTVDTEVAVEADVGMVVVGNTLAEKDTSNIGVLRQGTSQDPSVALVGR